MEKSDEIEGELSIQNIAKQQINRCLISASMYDPSSFEMNVTKLLSILPKKQRDAIREREEEYIETYASLKYKHNCGVPMGTPENPVKDEQTGSIISPVPVEETTTNYDLLYEFILEAFEEIGVSWKPEQQISETGAE